jgi:6-phosphogluconolactonase (cycloisomerase 2 family)
LFATLDGIYSPYNVEYDETEGKIFVISSYANVASQRIAIVDLATFTMIKSSLLTSLSQNGIAFIAADKANKCLYVVGSIIGGSINKVIYA